MTNLVGKTNCWQNIEFLRFEVLFAHVPVNTHTGGKASGPCANNHSLEKPVPDS